MQNRRGTRRWCGSVVRRRGEGGVVKPCYLVTPIIEPVRATLGVGGTQHTRVDVPRNPPTPPSSAGDPLGGPSPHSLQSPQLTLRGSAGTAGNFRLPD
jgi:hypothetical protein